MKEKNNKLFIGILGLIVLGSLLFVLSGQKPSADTKQISVEKMSQENKVQFTSLQKECKNRDKLLASAEQKKCVESDEFLYSSCGGFYE